MKKYILSGAATLLLSALATPGYCTTIVLTFTDTTPGPGTITYTPPANSGGINNVPLLSFTGIPFDTVNVSGGADAGTYSFTSSGSGFSFVTPTGPLTESGSFTTAAGTASGTLITANGLTVTSYSTNSLANIEVGFSSPSSVSINSALETALGLSGPVTVTLNQDPYCGTTPPGPGVYPQQTGWACAAGYNAQSGSAGGVDSQYLQVTVSTTTAPSPSVPEPQTSLLLGFGLVAVGSVARKRRQKV